MTNLLSKRYSLRKNTSLSVGGWWASAPTNILGRAFTRSPRNLCHQLFLWSYHKKLFL